MGESTVRLLMSDAGLADEDGEWAILVEQAATGDVAAFEQIMFRTERQVLTTARRILGNPADAEEAAQEVFLRVYKYLHRFDRTKAFEPWLYRLTINVCNDIASRRPRVQDVVPLPNHQQEDVSPDPDDSLTLTEQRRQIQSALRRLPERQRAAVVLRDLQGLSVREVAEVMKVSEATVRSHLSAARLRLKQVIQKIRRSV
jgi:RNA polymerase sigma-70 factor (ECF subfamily)